MRHLLFTTIFCLTFFQGICQTVAEQAVAKDEQVIHLADPTIFPYGEKFYLYGTVEGNTGKGFLVYVSDDLKKWKLSDKNEGYALKKEEAFGTAGFWAPQVLSLIHIDAADD